MVTAMNAYMGQSTREAIGNPVDMWWNETRQHIDIHLMLLKNIPPALNIEVAANEIEKTYEYLIEASYPSKAAEARAYLLRSVEHLKNALEAIQSEDRPAILENYNMAYNRYISVCRILLERGIFEPVPRSQKTRVQ